MIIEYQKAKNCREIGKEIGLTKQMVHKNLISAVNKVYDKVSQLPDTEGSPYNSFMIMINFFGVTCPEDVNMVMKMLKKNKRKDIIKDARIRNPIWR